MVWVWLHVTSCGMGVAACDLTHGMGVAACDLTHGMGVAACAHHVTCHATPPGVHVICGNPASALRGQKHQLLSSKVS